MPTYSDLEPGKFYLIRDDAGSDIEMVSVLALTDRCILVRSFGQVEEDFWKLREDSVAELIEEMDYDSASAILSLYDEEEDEEEEDWGDDDE